MSCYSGHFIQIMGRISISKYSALGRSSCIRCSRLAWRDLSVETLRFNPGLIFRAQSTRSAVMDKIGSSSDINGRIVPLIENLTTEENTRILQVVNGIQRSEDLAQYFVPKKKAEELIKIKNLQGTRQISSLHDVASILGIKSCTKFICTILEKPIPVSMKSAMFPVVNATDVERISSVISLVIIGDKISWSLVKRTATPEDEEVQLQIESLHQLTYAFKPRMHFLALLKEMKYVIKQIPESDLFVTEEYPSSALVPYMFNFQLQMAQARAMLLGLLSSRSEPPTITSIGSVAVAKLFNTFVGSEKVSGQHIVENMISNHNLSTDSVRNYYDSVDVSTKESLSRAILLNMAYWKLTQQIS